MVTTEAQADPAGSAELLSQARDGDAQAYCVLAEACETRLFRQAVALCRNPSLSEDLVAETLVEGWRSLKRFDGRCRLSTWLYAILVHRSQKSVRKARSRPVSLASLRSADETPEESLLEQLHDSTPLPPEALMEKERARRLRDAVDALPPTHQPVVLLRFYEGASLPEVAAALGLSLGTVKSRLHYALEKLRRMKLILNLSARTGDTKT